MADQETDRKVLAMAIGAAAQKARDLDMDEDHFLEICRFAFGMKSKELPNWLSLGGPDEAQYGEAE